MIFVDKYIVGLVALSIDIGSMTLCGIIYRKVRVDVLVNGCKSIRGGGLNGIHFVYNFGWFISIINVFLPSDK